MSTETKSPDHLAADQAPARTWASYLSNHPLIVLGGVLVILVLVTTAVKPSYLSLQGLRNTLLLAAPLGILAAGQTVLMLTRGIDLSAAMIATAAAYVAGNQSPNGAAIAIALGLVVGIAAGAANGVGVGVFRVNPLIMTLAMAGILLGLFTQWAATILQGSTNVAPFIRTIGAGSFLNHRIPWNVFIWAAVAFIVIGGLRRSGLGRMIYAVGDNPTAARLAGVRSWQVLLAAYVISGFFAALAGILIAGQSGTVDLRLAQNFLLPSVAAAVIGGTSIFGGVGTYSGTIFGALILSVLNSMLTFLDARQAVKQVVYGMIVLGLAWLYAAATRAE
ncbi:MAG TPA: ABC transporter permease [Actinomycetota bacterium]|jgi:ribose transport system permease protein|nr:ABC transporter permease [Actinomycetota bacterium]